MIPFRVTIWTSSHGTEKHYFPQSLNNYFVRNTHFLYPVVNAKPGRLTNDLFIKEFLSDFERIPKEINQLNVILMGDNDLRRDKNKGAFHLFVNIQKLIEMHLDTSHALLVLGLLPCPYSIKHSDLDRHFEISDFKIEKEIRQLHSKNMGKNIGFSRTRTFFNEDQNLIDWYQYFERDGVHLKRNGSDCLARNMLQEIESFCLCLK